MIRSLIKSSTPINNINLIKMIKISQFHKKNLKQESNSTNGKRISVGKAINWSVKINNYRSKQHNQINKKQHLHHQSEKNNG